MEGSAIERFELGSAKRLIKAWGQRKWRCDCYQLLGIIMFSHEYVFRINYDRVIGSDNQTCKRILSSNAVVDFGNGLLMISSKY
jgi:hypothetical protein